MNLRFKFLFLIPFIFSLSLSGESQDTIDSLEIALRVENNPDKKVDLLLLLTEKVLTWDSDVALNHANHALDIALAAEYFSGELHAMNILSEVWFDRTDLKLAMDYAVRARLLASQLGDAVQYGHALYNMGKIYGHLGNYERSSELYYESLKIAEENKDLVSVVKALNSIGIIHHNQNNFEKALEYYSKALQKAREINYVTGISRGLNNVAAIYGTQGDFESVAKFLKDAIALNLKNNNMDLVGVNYLNIGYYYQETGKYDSAMYFYNKAMKIYEQLNNVSSVISAKIFIAGFYLEVEDFSAGLETAINSLEESRLNGLKRFEYESATILRKIYFAQQDSIKAYRYQILELNMKDSLNFEESRTHLATLELQYMLEKEEQQKKTAQQRKDLITIILVLSLLFIIIVVVLLMGRMRIKARSVILEKEKLEMNLELKNKELTANVMSIMKKNETLSQIANRLKSIQREAVKDETKTAIRKITIALNKAVEEESWDEFEVRFKQVHNDFYDKLIYQYPNLSPQEQRLCAFLRLNMTSKEISEITGQRISTIEMARTRLRKKLGITNTQTNLIIFLAQI